MINSVVWENPSFVTYDHDLKLEFVLILVALMLLIKAFFSGSK